MTELRAYQGDVIAAFYGELAAGRKRIILVAPTGSGKTIIAAAIICAARAAYRKVVVLANRREIIAQTSDKLHAAEIMHGIIQAGFSARPLEPVQVASVATLHVRAIRSDKMELPPAELLIIDEAHHCPAASYRKIIDAYPDAVLLGLTATPCRGDGRGLGGIFETLIECPQVAALIEQKYLVPTRCYAPTTPDLVGVRMQAGDYAENQLADRMDRPKLVGDVVTHWHKYGERRKTVCFAVNVAHSVHIRDEFIRSGVRAEHIDGGTPKAERDATLQRLGSGEIDVVTNCMVLTEGWDMPEVGCCILARPTKKMGLYRQMIGRVLRPAPGKADAIVIDHSGAVFRHGFAEDPVEWTLDPDRRAESAKHAARCEFGGAKIVECSQCGALRTENGRAKPSEYNRYEWHAMLAHIAQERGYKPGWAAYKFKEKFGHWPQMRSIAPIAPSPEVRSWVRSRQIAYAKSRQAAGGAA
jgi:DNA repair protein RadD